MGRQHQLAGELDVMVKELIPEPGSTMFGAAILLALLASAGSLMAAVLAWHGRSQILLDPGLQVTCAAGAASLLMHARAKRV